MTTPSFVLPVDEVHSVAYRGDSITPQVASDELLLAVARDGNECADAINRLAGGSLGGLVLARLRRLVAFDDDQARDLAQETWLQIWKARGTWVPDSPGSVVNFILTVAQNVYFASNRANTRRVRRHEEIEPSGSESVDLDLLIDLETAFFRLRSGDRELLKFAYEDGLSDSEIASALGISTSAAKKRRQVALKRLRAVYVSPPKSGHTDPSL
jgi:RNA polymerase sigma factor (sigma-70 family)